MERFQTPYKNSCLLAERNGAGGARRDGARNPLRRPALWFSVLCPAARRATSPRDGYASHSDRSDVPRASTCPTLRKAMFNSKIIVECASQFYLIWAIQEGRCIFGIQLIYEHFENSLLGFGDQCLQIDILTTLEIKKLKVWK